MLDNFSPSLALAPYIRRHYLLRMDMPADAVISDVVIAETAFIRIPLRGDWEVKSGAGDWQTATGPTLFGANAKPFPLRVSGPFVILGCSIKPSGWRALVDAPAHEFTDKFVPLSALWDPLASEILSATGAEQSNEQLLELLEAAIAVQLKAINCEHEDMEVAHFEAIGRLDSSIKIADAAQQVGLSVRQLERRCHDKFGMSPKAILRRCRFLDMATAMRGFGNPSDAHLARLRYFDQSHLNREFRRFVNMTPRAFNNALTPLMTSGLLLRSQGEVLFKR